MKTPGHSARWGRGLALVLLLVALPCAAAAEPFVSESSMEADTPVAVGDRLVLTTMIEHGPGAQVEITSPPEGSRWRELRRQVSTDDGDSRATTKAVIDYAIFRTGHTTGPPVSARITDGDSTVDIGLDLHPVDVESVSSEGDPLSAARGPWPLLGEGLSIVWFAAGTAGFGFLVLLGAIAIRRRRYADEPALEIPAHEAARADLVSLQGGPLLADQRWHEFYVRLSEIVRRYLGRRFSFPGTELTTTEICARLGDVDDAPATADFDEIGRWLRACDRVKFAGYLPSEAEALQALDEAFEIIVNTKPDEPVDEGRSTATASGGAK